MYYRSRKLPLKLALSLVMALILNSIALLAPQTAPTVYAQTGTILLQLDGPGYVQAGQTLTYELTLKNSTNQTYTGIKFFNDVPAKTTYVSGGALLTDTGTNQQYIEFTLASLAPNASHTVSWVARANNGLAVGTLIENKVFDISEFSPGGSHAWTDPVGTVVEAPGTLVAVYKNAQGRAFDVTVDSYKFSNFGNEAPRVFSDDLGKDDLFLLFGPKVCASGTTAATCKLTGPAAKWLQSQINGMAGGHCEGMAATSLRLFASLPFKGKSSPATFQPGATRTADLNFPAQALENYISYYFVTQSTKEYSDPANDIVLGPVQLINLLTTDFNKATPVPYTVGFYKTAHLDKLDNSDWSGGHAVTAYGVETVSPTESRILLYDNNYPKQRKYITVNMAANTWRYVTASTPGQPEEFYEGSAVSGNLSVHRNDSRDRPAGQYFKCPFCPNATVASAQISASDLISGELDFKYTGEGAILIVNDAGQKTGTDLTTNAFVNEIPGAEVQHFRGGLNKEIPPFIDIPFAEQDNTIYSVYVHGKSVVTPTSGMLSIHGPGFSIGVNDIELDAGEVFEFGFSPDGDHISFSATETITAPEIYIAHDPIHPGDPSIIFDVEGISLLAGEEVWLDLDPALERIYFDHSGPEAENFVVDMKHVWPDGTEQDYAETIHQPAGTTSSFIDFGAWDGLLHPPTYINDVLQNPSINHRLKLEQVSGVYNATAQANAPAGVYHVTATFKNVTTVQLTDLSFSVANLAAGNMLLNADGSPAGAGAKLSLPNTALGADGLLHVNESVTVRFSVGLASANLSALTINANGVPHDWTHEAPPLAGEAHNASFVFTVRADNPLYLPLVAR